MQGLIRLFKVLLALGLVAVAGPAAWVYSGRVQVAADVEHHALTHWLLETARERAVARAARRVQERLPALGKDQLLEAVAGFEDMCAGCHVPPGRAASALARGLNPAAPDLVRAARERTGAELFWVTRHGIRMTGMPAWGITHSDNELWPLVALILRFPEFGAGEYERLLEEAKAAGIEHDHDHDHGHHHEHDHGHDHGQAHREHAH
jgi:mono/diheme cytochrome c family protein